MNNLFKQCIVPAFVIAAPQGYAATDVEGSQAQNSTEQTQDSSLSKDESAQAENNTKATAETKATDDSDKEVATGQNKEKEDLSKKDEKDEKDFAEFDSDFLYGAEQGLDLSRFNYENTLMPGEYQPWTTLNNQLSFEQNVIIKQEKGKDAQYCFKKEDLEKWGVRLDKIPEDKLKLLESDCIEINKLIPNASFLINSSEMTAQLNIPQAYLLDINSSSIDPKQWDYGINAGFVRYNLYAAYTDGDDFSGQDNYNASLATGINLGRWRFRHSGSYTIDNDHDGHYSSLSTYVQTDVTPLRAQFTAGEYFTPGDILDSIPFTGVQMGSDDSMLPENERGYAPTIRGTAKTNAEVEVSQEGRVIYTTNVPPGDFVIKDLYATSYAGDLDVKVTEANGEEKSFVVPFSAVVQMLRPGSSRFNVAAGKYRNDDSDDEPWFGQGTYRRGITNNVTLYGGGIVSDGYYSGTAGIAYGTPIGAFAFDITGAYADDVRLNLSDSQDSEFGQSYRITYNKLIQSTSTNIAVAAYEYSSEDYVEFDDFAQTHNLSDDEFQEQYDDTGKEKSRFQLNISQPISTYGNFYVSGYYSNYWDDSESETNYQIGYNHDLSFGTLTLSAERTFDEDDDSDDSFSARLSIPLDFNDNSLSLSTEYDYDKRDHVNSVRTDISGSAGESDQVNYGLYANESWSSDIEDTFGYGGNIQYYSPYARLSANASFSDNNNQYSGTMSGTVIGYSGGLVVTPDQGETMAVIEADGAKGAKVKGSQGAEIGRFGNAAMTGLSNYRYNEISLDPGSMPNSVELKGNTKRIVPRRGAIVKATFDTSKGNPLFLKLNDPEQVPFGAEILNEKDQTLGFVGQGGIVYVRDDFKKLKLQWRTSHSVEPEQCTLDFKAPEKKDDDSDKYSSGVIPARCI